MADEAAQRLKEMAGRTPIAHRILIVDDDPDITAALKKLLQDNGFDVLTAKDGGQAHSTIAMRQPDFVILDLILPGESGFEVCDHIKRHHSDLPVLILSVIDMPDSRELATRVGADGYLTKPFDPDRLLAKIAQIAQKRWKKAHLGQTDEQGRIRFTCGCGKKFRVSAVHRGRTMTCPDCGSVLTVPSHN